MYLHIVTSVYIYHIVHIIIQPMDAVVCRGSDMNVSCGYWSANLSYVTWIINGISLDETAIGNNPYYQLNNLTTIEYSLTVFSIYNITTFQCIVHSIANTTNISKLGTVTVIGMYVCMYVYMYVCMYVCMYVYT